MSSSPIESEDLDNVPLVRMEDVQPSRERTYVKENAEDIETCIIQDIDYDSEYIIKSEDDSNIGSMVSVRTEDEEEEEMIVPDIHYEATTEYPYQHCTKTPNSWPTLEILPGGVIKKPDKVEEIISSHTAEDSEKCEMMYACAKCPQKFKFLFCLVKHVRWHEDEAKKKDNPRIKREYNRYSCTHKRKVIICMKPHKKKTPKKAKS